MSWTRGKSQTPKDRVGENLYNRGVLNSIIIAEGIRNAQKVSGKKQITGEDMRRGLETLNITEARLKEIGANGFAAPMKIACDDHNGHNAAYMAKWDGTKWTKGSDWIEPLKSKVRPLIDPPPKTMLAPMPAGRSVPRLVTSPPKSHEQSLSPPVAGEVLVGSQHVGSGADHHDVRCGG